MTVAGTIYFVRATAKDDAGRDANPFLHQGKWDSCIGAVLIELLTLFAKVRCINLPYVVAKKIEKLSCLDENSVVCPRCSGPFDSKISIRICSYAYIHEANLCSRRTPEYKNEHYPLPFNRCFCDERYDLTAFFSKTSALSQQSRGSPGTPRRPPPPPPRPAPCSPPPRGDISSRFSCLLSPARIQGYRVLLSRGIGPETLPIEWLFQVFYFTT